MIKLNYRNADAKVVGNDNGLDIQGEFTAYQDKISEIIKNLKENDQLGWTFTNEENAVEGVKS